MEKLLGSFDDLQTPPSLVEDLQTPSLEAEVLDTSLEAEAEVFGALLEAEVAVVLLEGEPRPKVNLLRAGWRLLVAWQSLCLSKLKLFSANWNKTSFYQ
jgi:hypothetical protein